MAKRKADIRTKIGIAGYGDGFIERTDGSRTYLFSYEPSNLAVLSDESIRQKIDTLSGIAGSLHRIEYYTLDDRENYSKIRSFLQKRIREETSPKIKAILIKDEQWVRQVEADASSARRFLIGYHVSKPEVANIDQMLGTFQEYLGQNLIRINALSKQDVQEVIAMYFRQDISTPAGTFEDIDGQNGTYTNLGLKSYEFEQRGDEVLNEKIQEAREGAYQTPVADFDFNNLYKGKGKK